MSEDIEFWFAFTLRTFDGCRSDKAGSTGVKGIGGGCLDQSCLIPGRSGTSVSYIRREVRSVLWASIRGLSRWEMKVLARLRCEESI